MKDKKIKYFVVSLPRTGTSTVTKAAKILGLNPIHAPTVRYRNLILNSDIDFFSDTPIYRYDVIYEIMKIKEFNSKFIYIDRDFKDVFNSWINCGLYRNYEEMYNNLKNNKSMHGSRVFDINSYNLAFGDEELNENNYDKIFNRHKNKIIDLINSEDLLIYNLYDKWKSLCQFMGVETPEVDFPHLNKGKMFDKI